MRVQITNHIQMERPEYLSNPIKLENATQIIARFIIPISYVINGCPLCISHTKLMAH